MAQISCESCTNANCFVKLYCSEEWIQKISSSKYQTSFKPNEKIINEGEPVLGIFFIQKGKVKVYSTDLAGRKLIVRFASDGQILGHTGSANDVYTTGAAAIEKSLICFVVNDSLNKMLMDNPSLSIGLMKYYSGELRRSETRMRNIAHMNVREKVAEALLILHSAFATKKDNSPIPLSRQDVADVAGTSKGRVIKQITEFRDENILTGKGKNVIISNPDKLKKIVKKFHK